MMPFKFLYMLSCLRSCDLTGASFSFRCGYPPGHNCYAYFEYTYNYMRLPYIVRIVKQPGRNRQEEATYYIQGKVCTHRDHTRHSKLIISHQAVQNYDGA